MKQDQIKLEIIKQFTSSLELKNGKIVTTLDEDDYYEFKKSLHITKSGISKDYLKTIAGLANNKGGLMIFGIDPDSQELVGIKETHENLDNKYVNMVVSELLDGMSSFYFFTNRHDDKLIGFLIINEPIFKPVIIKSSFSSNEGAYVAGDIYYRYPGESMKIKPSDLRTLMSKEISRHAEQLISQITKLVEIGPENAAIINSKTGEIEANNSKLILSQEILKDLNLIMEGNFVEKDGAPAYVIKGNIELESGKGNSQIIKEQTALHNRDYHSSLLENNCSNPKNFLKDIVCRNTFNLPIFNLIRSAKMSNQEAINLLESQNNTDVNQNTKDKIIERIKKPTICLNNANLGTIKKEIIETELNEVITLESLKLKYSLKGNSNKTIIRTLIFNNIKNNFPIDPKLKEDYFNEFIEAFSHLSKEDVIRNQSFYFSELNQILKINNEKLTKNSVAKTNFRKVICLLDYQLHSDELN